MNTKIRCLLLDDELPGLTYLKMLCEQIEELEVVKAYISPDALLAEWQSLDFDLLISDIEMPGSNGLQVAEALKGKAVIFTTAYKDFAVDAFDRDAVDYVVKPVKPERLQQAVQKLINRMQQAKPLPRQLQLNTDKGKALIAAEKIFCIIASDIDSRDKVLLLDDNTRIVAKNYSFDKLLDMLPHRDFIRVNKKAALAVKHVQYFSYDEITSGITDTDGRAYTFPLSEIYRSDFIKRIKQ